MRRVLLTCACFVVAWLVTQPASAAVAHVQTINAQGFGSSATLTSGSLTTGAASLLIAGVGWYDNRAITSVMLDGVTAFTFDLYKQRTGDSATRGAVYSLANVSAGSHTVTVTWEAETLYKNLYVTEVSGALTADPLDGAGATMEGDDTACSSGSYGATGTSFWFGLAVIPSNATFTAGAGGWAIPSDGSSGSSFAAVEYKANPGSSPQTANWTNDSHGWVCMGAAYKIAAAPPPGGQRHRMLWGLGH